MKTLAQIEPRVDIATLEGDADSQHVISNSGSYYLTGNLAVFKEVGLRITAPDVTIDLNGFQIHRGFLTEDGQAISLEVNAGGCSISNGSIRGPFANGIGTVTSPPTNIRIADVSVAGCTSGGIVLGRFDSTLVVKCNVYGVGGTGIQAGVVSECTSTECGGTAIDAINVSNSRANTTNDANGISSFTAVNCQGSSIGGTGIVARVARDCIGGSNSGVGLDTKVASNCMGASVSNVGLLNLDGVTTSSMGTTETGLAGISGSNVHASNGIASRDGDGIGIIAGSATHSVGEGRSGIAGFMAIGCLGDSSESDGISADLVCQSWAISEMGNGINSAFNLHLPSIVHSSIGITENPSGLVGGITGLATTAAFSQGLSEGAGSPTGIAVESAIGCDGLGILSASRKSLGTP